MRWLTLLVLAAAPAAFGEETPERIISLSPSVTEIVHGVGAFERVVAVSSFCRYPPEVADLPRVGGWTNTNLEQVMALDPDLVILTDAQAPLVEDRLRALGIRTLAVGSQSLDDIFEAVERIGKAVGNEGEARQVAREMRRELDAVRKRVRGRDRPSVLTVVDRLPGTLRDIYVATEGSYLVDLVRIAGGEPLTPEAPHNYAQLGVEALVALDPEVIFDMVQALNQPAAVVGAGKLAEDPRQVWGAITVRAVRDGRIYPLHDERLVHPSQHAVYTARKMARRLHPDAFPEEVPP